MAMIKRDDINDFINSADINKFIGGINKRVYIPLASNLELAQRDVQSLELVATAFNQSIIDYCQAKKKKRIRYGCKTAEEIKRETVACELFNTMSELTRYTVEELFDTAVEEYAQGRWHWKRRV